ncbi:hypothetical protein [Actinokineospora inagensis]|uniref:hypothetical protein n=1 Tax=Actinokineospora inagensis TaxID=103730 RepID=UPI00047B4392|nr:hypothetical protein [Actinokineospora inagensis]
MAVGWLGRPRLAPDWKITEGALGLTLPDDYKRLGETIPVGSYGGVVDLQPPSPQTCVDLRVMFARALDILRSIRKLPYPVYPDVPGLLPWARCRAEGAGMLFWLTDGGDPNDWPVVPSAINNDRWEEFDVGAVEFLLALVTDELPSEILRRRDYKPKFASDEDLFFE